MSRLSHLAVSKRSVTILLALALFVAGVSAWGSLKQELLPDLNFPILTIVAPYPGAGAGDVAEQVTKPIERAIGSAPRLERLQSTSANSLALIVARFAYGTDLKETKATIEQDLANAGLPSGVQPTVSSFDLNASPVIIASVAGKGPDGLAAAARIARSEIAPDLQALDGVARADVTGGLTQRLLVTLDPLKLAAAGVSEQQVIGVLQANNLTVPAGQLPSSGRSVPVSTVGSLGSADEIRALVVRLRPAATGTGSGSGTGAPAAASTPVTVGDLGSVELQGVATTGYALTDGDPSLTITVSKTSTGNTVAVADAIRAKLDQVAAAHPGEISVAIVQDLSSFIKESRDGLLREGGLGALFAVLTIFLFLFSLRSTLVAAVSIPLSILSALVVMELVGISVNIMTLGGLAVAVGRVVDDAIVVLENIYRHRALGEDRWTAVRNGPREVAAAITGSTLTTIGVFLPIGFVGGIVSQFFLPFALTVTFALVASLVCALTVVPVLAYLFIDRVQVNVDEHGEPRRSLWVRAYTPVIRFALRDRWTKLGVVGFAGLLFAGTLALAPLLPTQFISAGSDKVLAVTLAPPAGASSQAVLDAASRADRILRADPKVQLVQASVPAEGDTGRGTLTAAFGGQPANSATLTVSLAPDVDLTVYARRLADELAPLRAEGYEPSVSQAAGFTSNNLEVVLSSADASLLGTATDRLLAALRDQPDLINLKTDLAKAAPQVQVTVDPNKAIGANLSAAQVAGEVRNALTGQVATRVTLADAGAVDVFVRLDPARVGSVEALQVLPVGSGTKVPLGSIATVAEVDAQGTITRIDQAPAATVGAEITGKDTGAVSKAVQATVDRLKADGSIPAGVQVELAGVTQQQNSAFGGLFSSMAVAILLVYVMLVLTFNSLVTPFVILFSLPLATIGAFPALLLTGRAIGISSLIGFLMLIGIVVTNAIVLLDLVEQNRARGMAPTEALIEGGRTRVRPILMTAIATMLALSPLAAGFNQGSIIASDLGTVVIGGLFSSTFLTLIVVPVVYSLVDDLKRRLRRGAAVGETAGAPRTEAQAPG